MRRQKALLASIVLCLSNHAFAGNPNNGGTAGVDQTARDAANTAQQKADTNEAKITALENPSHNVGDDLTATQGGFVGCTLADGGFNLIVTTTNDTPSFWSDAIGEIGLPAKSNSAGAANSTAIIGQFGLVDAARAKVPKQNHGRLYRLVPTRS